MLNSKTHISSLINKPQGPPNPPPTVPIQIGQDSPGNKFQPLYGRVDTNKSIEDSQGTISKYLQASPKLVKITEPLCSDNVDNIKPIEIQESTLNADQNELISQTEFNYDFSKYDNLRGGGLDNSDNFITDGGDTLMAPSLFLPTIAIVSTTIVTGFLSGIGLGTGFFFTQKYIIPWLNSFERPNK